MPVRKKKHPRLPNGFGSIKWLGKGRNNPYGVYPPVKEFNLDGIPETLKALAYVDDWLKGFTILLAYKNGTYYEGMEADLPALDSISGTNMNDIITRIISEFAQVKAGMTKKESPVCPTFAEVYEAFFKDKYETGIKQYSKSSQDSTKAAYSHCKSLYNLPFIEIRHSQLQKVVDSCDRKHATKELIVSLIRQMYRYAIKNDITEKDCSLYVSVNMADDDEHGVPFSDTELGILKKYKDKYDSAELLLILSYCGCRINELRNIEINLKEGYFFGGSKTAAGKNRYIPIHSSIMPLVERRLKKYNSLLPSSYTSHSKRLYDELPMMGIEKHTFHDTRHTFNRLCDKYKVDERMKKIMLGHAFTDVTNKIYGHWDLSELKKEIEKLVF